MIISASRRTDIPAFYSDWLMDRLREGFADVANPFNRAQTRRVDLKSESVDCIVFWTRNARPLIKYLRDLDRAGYRYYFLYTITGYPKVLEENLPPLRSAVSTFRSLSRMIGPARIIWRYDPIVLSSITDEDYHIRNFENISEQLDGYMNRCIVSFVDYYRKIRARMKRLSAKENIEWIDNDPEVCLRLASKIADIAGGHGFVIQSCAEDIDLTSAGIVSGACIDGKLINCLFGLQQGYNKDPHQRAACNCVRSVDIGAYDTCGYRCLYCYANGSFRPPAADMRKTGRTKHS